MRPIVWVGTRSTYGWSTLRADGGFWWWEADDAAVVADAFNLLLASGGMAGPYHY
jgi:hypothetical protein